MAGGARPPHPRGQGQWTNHKSGSVGRRGEERRGRRATQPGGWLVWQGGGTVRTRGRRDWGEPASRGGADRRTAGGGGGGRRAAAGGIPATHPHTRAGTARRRRGCGVAVAAAAAPPHATAVSATGGVRGGRGTRRENFRPEGRAELGRGLIASADAHTSSGAAGLATMGCQQLAAFFCWLFLASGERDRDGPVSRGMKVWPAFFQLAWRVPFKSSGRVNSVNSCI